MKTIKQAAARQALEAMKEMGLHSSTYAAEGRAFAATKATARKFLQRIQKAAGEIGKASQEDGEQATSLLCQISPYPRQLVFKGWHDLESWLGEVETLLESVAGYEEPQAMKKLVGIFGFVVYIFDTRKAAIQQGFTSAGISRCLSNSEARHAGFRFRMLTQLEAEQFAERHGIKVEEVKEEGL